MPNIRIQVNTNNLQNPPYVLDAIREANQPSKAKSNSTLGHNLKAADSKQNVTQVIYAATGVTNTSIRNTQSSVIVASPTLTTPSSGHNSFEATQRPLKPSNNLNKTELVLEYDNEIDADSSESSGVREDSLEEALELELESVLKLAPEALINEVAKQELKYKPANHTKKVTADPRMAHDFNLKAQKTERNTQLPVSNSHLKRPVLDIHGDDDHLHIGYNDSVVQQSGARSRVSPTVSTDDTSTLPEKKPTLPDTLEPGQVVLGATNKSVIPATILKDYGSQSRTRITLGGGYVRDKQTAETPDECPASSTTEPPLIPPAPVMPQLNLTELSRVIQLPERIVLPADVIVATGNQRRRSDRYGSNNTQPVVQQPAGELDSRCPKRGVVTYEHPKACDKYYLCIDGYSTEQMCPNGLLYGTRDTVVDYCVHRWNVVCGEKTIPNPISSPGCRWQYGISNVQGSPRCTPDYFECKAGVFEVKKCPLSGQVYDDRTKSCQYAEKNGCADEIKENFQCPRDDHGNTYWPFPRYFLNERAIIQCINGEPQVMRCADDQRVDPEHLNCIYLSKTRSDK